MFKCSLLLKDRKLLFSLLESEVKWYWSYVTPLVTASTTLYCMKNCSFPPKRMLRVPPPLCVNKTVADTKKSNTKTS